MTPKYRVNLYYYVGVGFALLAGLCLRSGIRDDDRMLTAIGIIAATVFLVLMGLNLANDRCPSCRRFIDLRGGSAYCPKCGKWIPLNEGDAPPGDA